MQLKLCCYCCGNVIFEVKVTPEKRTIEGFEALKKGKTVVCKKCGLEDYIDNLIRNTSK
ncbi:MAG: hypothetical protein ACRC1T_03325 [Clostridium chrysemydis]|uniref:hypothetical protein n=1 Tax=Clostridium chrysemydis TaxID=2665504 RepID=UPI003F3C47C4